MASGLGYNCGRSVASQRHRSIQFPIGSIHESQQSPRGCRGGTDGRQWSDLSDAFAQEGVSRRSSSRQRAVSRISKRCRFRSSRSRVKTSRRAASTTSRKSARACRTSSSRAARAARRHELPHARNPERRHLHRRHLAGRHGRLLDERVRRHRSRRGACAARRARCSAATRPAARSGSGHSVPAEEFGGNIAVTAGSLDRTRRQGTLDLPFSENVRTKWTGANLNRDGYIYSQTTGQMGGAIDQQVLRGDIVWDATEKLRLPVQLSRTTRAASPSRACMDAMYRTFDDPNARWVKSIIGMPEVYTYVGTDFRGNPVEPMYVPDVPGRGLSRRPRRRSREPLERVAPEPVRHRATLARDELAAHGQPVVAVPDGADRARRRLRHRVG